jgi:hypothetical protein
MNQVVLPPNVSGFFDHQPPALLPVKELQQGIEGLRTLEGFKDLVFADCTGQTSRSYHWALLELKEGSYFIFLNKYHRIAACSRIKHAVQARDWEEELPENMYVHHSGIFAVLEETFTVLYPELLMLPIDPDKGDSVPVVARLQLSEFAEFSFWEPRNIGQVVFNNWEK